MDMWASWEAFGDSDGHLDKEIDFVFMKRAGKREFFLEKRKKKHDLMSSSFVTTDSCIIYMQTHIICNMT